MRIVTLLFAIVVFATASVSHAQTFELMDRDDITRTFQTSLAVLLERIAEMPPPRYIVRKAELTFAVTDGRDGRLGGKVPVGIVTADFAGEYQEITTTRQTLTFGPNPTIPTNFDDRGVLAFLTGLQDKTRQDLAAQSTIIITAFDHEEEFVIRLSGEGKLSFLSLAAAGVSANTKNSHKIKLHFCLMAADGTCYDG